MAWQQRTWPAFSWPYAFYVMDKAYVDFEALFTFHQVKSFWVSRPKGNMRFATIKQMEITDSKSRILEGSHIRLYKSSRLYPDNMRFIRVYDQDNDDIIEFISNNFEVGSWKYLPCTVTDGTSSLLQVDKVERHHENPLGVFGKCGQSTPLGGDYSLPYGGKDKSRLQKPSFNHRGGNFDPYLRHGKDWPANLDNQAGRSNHFKPKCQRTHFIW